MRTFRVRAAAVLCVMVIMSMVPQAHAADVAPLKAKAESGDVAAQAELARAYEKGEGVARNDDLAAKWYIAAAQQGNAQAQNDLGVLYRLGRGVERDKDQAVAWYRMAAKQGYAPAMFNLATAYYNGDAVGISDSHAYAWFVLAQRAGSKEAVDAVARMQADLSPVRIDIAKQVLAGIVAQGDEAPKDEAFALDLLRQVAEHGDRNVQFQLGRMYAEGKGAPQNSAEAVSYLTASGTPEAQEYLALMYLEGRSVPRDVRKGTEMLTKVANGSKSASLKLADEYWSGRLVPQDYKQALKRYTTAADTGDPHALYMLATAHRDGAGVSKNTDTACMYYVLAVSIGSGEALHDSRQAWCPAATLDNSREKAKKWLQRHPPVAWTLQQRLRDQQSGNDKGVERRKLSDPAKQ